MGLNLFLSPTTNNAVDHLLTHLGDFRTDGILTPVTFLLPTTDVIHDLRNQLGDTMGMQMYQFYRLGNAILDEAGIPIHLINDTAIRRLIRSILQEMNFEGLLTTFASVWEKPGFVEVLLDWIREMKSQGIFPEAYAEFAKENETDRDTQLAEIYLRYQNFMQTNEYSDPDGLLWVTGEALEENPGLFRKGGPIFVLGFDQFTPVQIRILRQLANRFTELNIYLLWDNNRSGDSLALSRLQRTRENLVENIPLAIQQIDYKENSVHSLAHLRNNIFETNEPQPVGSKSIQWIEAPSREIEIRRSLREVKQLLIQSVSAQKIAILTPNKNGYEAIARTVSTEFGIPIEYDQPLIGNPAVAALVNLLKLPTSFPWHTTFETLRSPYIQQSWLSGEQIEILDQLSRERPVIAGRDQWAFAVRPLALDIQDHEDEDLGAPPLVSILEPEILEAIDNGLMAFFDHMMPPATASYWDYTWWLQTAIIGYFPDDDLEDAEIESAPTINLKGACQVSPFPQRDLQALNLVMIALRRLLASAEIVPDDAEITWEKFRDDFFTLLSVMQIPSDPLQEKVRFARLEDGRARTVDYLFVLGLSEGEFPTRPPADPLYAPGEREDHPLPLIRYSPANDASLWWQVISNVNQQLILTRPYIDENGAVWQASPYWDAVLDCFTNTQVEKIPIAQHPETQTAASQNELLVALAHSNSRIIPDSFSNQWSYIQQAEIILQQRQSYQPAGKYEGILQEDNLRSELAASFGEQHVWSASRLNRYANCPYGFFAEHVLKLEAHPDPEEGLDALQRGSLLHAILEHLYRRLETSEISPTTENQDAILQYLDESCEAIFPSAPQRYGFRPGALWEYEQEELKRLLRALIIWECEQNTPTARFLPYMQEARFGIQREGSPPLEILGDQAKFRLRGMIDRLDRDVDRNLRVIDYKSGSTTYSKNDLQKGLALQTALYALAAERFLTGAENRVAESHYWHIPSRKASGSLKIDGDVLDDEVANAAIQQASWSVAQIRSGAFPSAPGKPIQGGKQCSSRCDFAPICRVTRQSIAKARRGSVA